MVKSRMMNLTGREKTNMVDTDLVVGWILYASVGHCWRAVGQEGERKLMWCGREGERM
jgi:hypothetical protein